jgi:hypothetical protein
MHKVMKVVHRTRTEISELFRFHHPTVNFLQGMALRPALLVAVATAVVAAGHLSDVGPDIETLAAVVERGIGLAEKTFDAEVKAEADDW